MAPKKRRRVRALDLFCGAGGSSRGASQAGVNVVAAFDSWSLAGQNHKVNFPETKFIHSALEDVDLSKLTKAIGRVDLILASPECTNHSPAKGNKPDNAESRNTALQVLRFAKHFKPRWIVIENVVSMRRWWRYKAFVRNLEKEGYHVREQVLDASDFGVPQSRRRLFLLCDRQQYPEEITPRKGTKKNAAAAVDLNGRYPWSLLKSKGRAKGTLARARRGIKEMGKSKPFLLVYYGSDHAGGWQRLERPLRTITTVDRFAIVKPSKRGFLMRMLQVPELQIAMGMRGMAFEHGTRRDRVKMLGNAVCPPVMRAIVKKLTRVTNG